MVDPKVPSPRIGEPDDASVGQILKMMRKNRGLTGQQLGSLAGMSQAKISRIETGAVLAELDDVEALARALGATTADIQQLLDRTVRSQAQSTEWRVGAAGVADRQREFADLEAETREVRTYQPAVVVGLLQTSEYARAVLTAFHEHLAYGHNLSAAGIVSEAVSARIRRHEVLDEPTKSFHFVMGESVFSNRLSGPAVMLAQIERIREVNRQDNVVVRIVPADADLTVPPYHGFELLDDRSVTVDLFNTTILSKVRSDIHLYRHVFDELEQAATTDIDPILDHYMDLYLTLTTQARTHPTGAGPQTR